MLRACIISVSCSEAAICVNFLNAAAPCSVTRVSENIRCLCVAPDTDELYGKILSAKSDGPYRVEHIVALITNSFTRREGYVKV